MGGLRGGIAESDLEKGQQRVPMGQDRVGPAATREWQRCVWKWWEVRGGCKLCFRGKAAVGQRGTGIN